MNKHTVPAIILIAAGTAVITANHFKIAREGREARARILVEQTTNLDAVFAASKIVNEKIMNGDYRNSPNVFDDIRSDMRFYEMTVRED